MTSQSSVDLGHLFLSSFHRIRKVVDEAMNDTGVSLSRAKVLGVLVEHGPMKQAAVATHLGFAPRSVTDTLDALEREGLAARGPDPSDRRAWLVEITPDGVQAHARAMAAKYAAMEAIFAGLDDAECAALTTALLAIGARLDSQLEAAHVS